MAKRSVEQLPRDRRKLLQHIAASVKAQPHKLPRKQLAEFITAYYQGVATEDLAEYHSAQLAAAALNHFKLGVARKKRQALLHIYNPTLKQHGWQSPHTIVELIVDDMPFLVDTISMVFAQLSLNIHLIVHPLLHCIRSATGAWQALAETEGQRESWQRFEIDQVVDDDKLQALQHTLLAALTDLRYACRDWQPMRKRALAICDEWRSSPPSLATDEIAEASRFLEWLADNHFTFLGSQLFELQRNAKQDVLRPVANTALGIMRRGGSMIARSTELRGAMRDYARTPQLILITKSGSTATIHRAAHLDHLSIKQFDKQGRVIGEIRFLGLFTSSAYSLNPRDIPLLRHKLEITTRSLGLLPGSHDAKAVQHVIDNYPRDELFQVDAKALAHNVRGIVNLYERRRVRLFMRRDPFGRFYSCLLYLPRDRYNTQVRERVEGHLLAALGGVNVESQVLLSDSALARLHLLIRLRQDDKPPAEAGALEQDITRLIRTWHDELATALIAQYGEAEGRALTNHYSHAFPVAYQADVSPDAALADITQLRNVLDSNDSMALRLTEQSPHLHLRVIRSGTPLPLSDVLPVLENLGLRVLTERPYEIEPQRARSLWIQDFELEPAHDIHVSIVQLDPIFSEAFTAIWQGQTENDGFNRLIVKVRLHWREVNVLRAYCRYLLQTTLPFSQAYMEQTLLRHADMAVQLWRLFVARFDPGIKSTLRKQAISKLTQRITGALDTVGSPDEDRILRAYLIAINASLRTNYYQRDSQGTYKSYLSIKIHSGDITHLPLPKPLFEIFVYSPHMEGIHLRTGHVARGGIRWSDRKEDFRTEILGLMKAQTVKNTLIVPVGAKGGFVIKQLPANATRDDMQREGVACYQTLIRGLLDLTDNIVNNKIVAPANVVRHDDDDPYLVVAADKGTASFSDIANTIAAEYHFWLGDAFASGGSSGYDHKTMAITARGAWECVKRHFRELNMDIDKQAFTAIGIGDMAGDVFGNGMLRSSHMKLLAAFNHQHIFIDPAPDAAASFIERQRLFNQPRSSWEDYDSKAISSGGGIYSRNAKSIVLSPAARQLLGVADGALAPQALIQAILRMPVDLFWNGGIGTYVKASSESHAAAGDRSNDAVRVNGGELRCKVVGEGGNLGFTQRGRIEYALQGGRINTDFVDNSAGVDCSDHEVNIKILLSQAQTLTHELNNNARDKLLSAMTEPVARLVLRDNYLQSQAISLAEQQSMASIQEHAFFLRTLELNQELDRELEGLPTAEEIVERHKQGRGFTRPELAVLVSYSKMHLYKRLIDSDVAEDAYLGQELALYFPEILTKSYQRLFSKHRLKREIICTAITNSMVNRMGITFALRMMQDTNADAATIARAYTIARESLAVRQLWQQIETLDCKVGASVQYQMMNESVRLLRFFTYWLIQQRDSLDIKQQVSLFKPGLQIIRGELHNLLSDDARQIYNALLTHLIHSHVPETLARQIALTMQLTTAPDIVLLAKQTTVTEVELMRLYQTLDQTLSFAWLRQQINILTVNDRWQAAARISMREQCYALQRALCLQVLQGGNKQPAAQKMQRWLTTNTPRITSAQHSLAELRTLNKIDFAALSVALQAIRTLLVTR